MADLNPPTGELTPKPGRTPQIEQAFTPRQSSEKLIHISPGELVPRTVPAALYSTWVTRLEKLEGAALSEKDYLKLKDEILEALPRSGGDLIRYHIDTYSRFQERKTDSYNFALSSRTKAFFPVLLALSGSALMSPDLTEPILHKLDEIAGKHNSTEKRRFSVISAQMASFNYLYPADDNLGALYGFADHITKLPGSYKYWAAAFFLFVHACHILEETLSNEANIDFNYPIPVLNFAARATRSGIEDPEIKIDQRNPIKEALYLGLTQMDLAAVSFLGVREEIKQLRRFGGSGDYYSVNWIGPLARALQENKPELIKAHKYISDLEQSQQTTTMAGMFLQWYFEGFFKHNYQLTTQATPIEQVLLRPTDEANQQEALYFWTHSSPSSKYSFTKRFLSDISYGQKAHDIATRSITNLNIDWRHLRIYLTALIIKEIAGLILILTILDCI